jgi:UDP-N-acetylglucosamine 3-dehydrogenase
VEERPLAVAVLGCGHAARLDGAALAAIGGDVRCFYASRDGKKSRDLAARLGGAGSFGSYEEALESPEIDVVLVATPPALHLELVLRSLAAGKEVIVEKPPFLRPADFDAVEEAQRRTGRRVLVAENYYYKPVARTLRRLLASGAIGEVLYLYVNALKQQPTEGWRADPVLAGGGALFEGGIHWVDLLANLGLSVRSARGLAPGRGALPDRGVLALFEYDEGAVGALYYSWEVPSLLRGLRISRIYGRRGSVAFESNGLFVAVWGQRRRLLLPGLKDLSGRVAMFRDFVRALKSGAEPEMTLARARRDVELVQMIEASVGSARSPLGAQSALGPRAGRE